MTRTKKSPPTFKKTSQGFLNKHQSHTVGGQKSSYGVALLF